VILDGKDAKDADASKLLEKLCKAGHLGVGEKDAIAYHV